MALLRLHFRRQEADRTVKEAQLAEAGARIIERRRHYLHTIAPQVEATFERISRSGLRASIEYQAKLRDRAVHSVSGRELVGIIAEQLERDQRRDRLRGFTHSGPHGDDVLVYLDGREAALHASQGQVRALVLALKITTGSMCGWMAAASWGRWRADPGPPSGQGAVVKKGAIWGNMCYVATSFGSQVESGC